MVYIASLIFSHDWAMLSPQRADEAIIKGATIEGRMALWLDNVE